MIHKGIIRRANRSLLRAKAYIPTLTNIIDEDTKTPKTNALKFFAFLDNPDKDVVTAVLETIPPIKPVSPIPFFVPTILVRTYQTNHIPETKTTISHVLYGLNKPRKP